MKHTLFGIVQLCRPANLPTAMADIFAGAAIAGVGLQQLWEGSGFSPLASNLFLLLSSSVLLYAGGVVLNDVFDFKIDVIERPERPIPNGTVSLKLASFIGAVLLLFGVVFAFLVTTTAGFIALFLALCILFYDVFAKKYNFLGPLSMGTCRALNLFLGMAIFGSVNTWWLGIIPLLYIFAITLISRGEVHGNNKKNIIKAGIIYVVVLFLVFISITLYDFGLDGVFNTGMDPGSSVNNWSAFLCLGLFIYLIMSSLVKAYRNNNPGNIKKAVITGVLSIIILDATFVMAFDTWMFGLIVLLLLPFSKWLAKIFAVT